MTRSAPELSLPLGFFFAVAMKAEITSSVFRLAVAPFMNLSTSAFRSSVVHEGSWLRLRRTVNLNERIQMLEGHSCA